MASWEKIIPFIKLREGGLSRDPDDLAAKYPAPCAYNGQTGWHTNKGITYETFITNTALGYEGTCENFFEMPAEIWSKIFKAKIWDQWQLDKIRSQSIADIIADWSFNSGAGGAYKRIRDLFNEKYKMDLPAQFGATSVESLRKKINSISFVREFQIRRDLLDKRTEAVKASNPKYQTGLQNRIDELEAETKRSVQTSYLIKGVISFFTLGFMITGVIIGIRAIRSKRN